MADVEAEELLRQKTEAALYILSQADRQARELLDRVATERIVKLVAATHAGYVGDVDGLRAPQFQALRNATKRAMYLKNWDLLANERVDERAVSEWANRVFDTFVTGLYDEALIRSQTSKELPKYFAKIVAEHMRRELPYVEPLEARREEKKEEKIEGSSRPA